MDANRIAEALRKLDAQDFNPGDSFLASLVNNPAGLLTKWLPKQINTAAGIPDQYDNPTPWLAPSVEDQIAAANNVAGIAQLGAFPTAPQVGKGTLGTMGGINAANAPKEQFAQAEAIAKALRLSDLPVGSDDWMNANRDIWGKTGIHYGADNMPRFEIDDSGFLFNPQKIDSWSIGSGVDQSLNSRMRDAVELEKEGFPANKIFKMTDMIKRGDSWEDMRPPNIETQAAIHPELSKNYSSDNLLFRSMDSLKDMGFNGNYDPGFNNLLKNNGLSGRIDYSTLARDPKSTALHELQHAIQQREGFARGGSPEGMNDIWNAARARLNFLEKEPGYLEGQNKIDKLWSDVFDNGLDEQKAIQIENEILQQHPELSEVRKQLDILRKIPRDSTDAYHRLAGEAEARAVQKRMNYTPEQRSQVFPLDDYDRNISDLIVRRGDGPNMSVGDNLNESLLHKYLTTGQLNPEEMAQYEANAVQMRDSNRQYLNVANADAQGGTAMDRAKGMGFDTDAYTGANISDEIESMLPKSWFSEQNKYASDYSNVLQKDGIQKEPRVYPVTLKTGKIKSQKYTGLYDDMEKALLKKRTDTFKIENVGGGDNNFYVIKDPKNIRSRFAAFDPLRKDSADLLASWLLPATMLGYGMYNQQPSNQSLSEALRGQ